MIQGNDRGLRLRFLQELGDDHEMLDGYQHKTTWTPYATRALVRTGCSLLDELEDRKPEVRFAAKHCAQLVSDASRREPDPYDRSEYFTADVTVYDDRKWQAPFFVGEHENDPSIERLQYEAWKLLSIKAEYRVLVGYWRGDSRHRDCMPSWTGMLARVAEVCEGFPDAGIFVIGGDWSATPRSAGELAATFKSEYLDSSSAATLKTSST